MIYPTDACAPPDLHWLDLPGDPDRDNEEEQEPERKPICTFVNKQTVFVRRFNGKLQEFPVPGDELHLGRRFEAYGGLIYGDVIGYVLNRHPDFVHPYYGWGLER